MRKRFIFLVLVFFFIVPELFADITVHVGPVAAGTGGSNPVSIPPIQLLEYEVVWINAKKREMTFGIVPGFLYGQRFPFSNGLYVSGGGGLVISANGIGPGVYAAAGFDGCGKTVCFNAEYKQALGISTQALIAPYAIRIGITIKQ